VERIVEEFRRYKVRSEIARKQRDSEQKHSSSTSPAPPPPSSSSVSIEQAMSQGALGYLSSSSSLQGQGQGGEGDDLSGNGNGNGGDMSAGMRARINKETNRWKLAYESVVKENEQLRHRGEEIEPPSCMSTTLHRCSVCNVYSLV
jgi:hypothetical protein